jgi:hypothetical protein
MQSVLRGLVCKRGMGIRQGPHPAAYHASVGWEFVKAPTPRPSTCFYGAQEDQTRESRRAQKGHLAGIEAKGPGPRNPYIKNPSTSEEHQDYGERVDDTNSA